MGRFEIKKNLCARKNLFFCCCVQDEEKIVKKIGKNLCVHIQGKLIKRNPHLMIMMMMKMIFFWYNDFHLSFFEMKVGAFFWGYLTQKFWIWKNSIFFYFLKSSEHKASQQFFNIMSAWCKHVPKFWTNSVTSFIPVYSYLNLLFS